MKKRFFIRKNDLLLYICAMSNISPNTPVIIGVAQFTQREQAGHAPLEPLRMIEKTVYEACQDTQAQNILTQIDSIFVTNIFGYQYADAPTQLAEILQITDQIKVKSFSNIGGNMPQSTVNRVCKDLEAGKLKAAILVGAEANYSLAKYMKSGVKPDWTPQKTPQYIDGENKLGTTDLENNYELFLLTNAYPIFETALRKRLGHTPAEHAAYLGELYAPFSKIASKNPFAWQQNAFSAAEIQTPSPENRTIAYPYTKRMCANNQVDEAATLILTTQAMAEAWGVPQNKIVYPVGGADLHDIWDFACRPDVTQSEAIAHCTKIALTQANLVLTDIQAFDLYSCFPVAVQIAREAIGILPQDTRPITLTGGLSYFGGAWNNYSMHAIAQAVQNIRQKPQNILLNALGWYITKHAIGIYSHVPTGKGWSDASKETHLADLQAEINAKALPAPIEKANGFFDIIGYTLLYDRDGTPKKGIALVGAGKERAWIFIEGDANTLAQLENTEWVGKSVQVQYDEKRKRNIVFLDSI